MRQRAAVVVTMTTAEVHVPSERSIMPFSSSSPPGFEQEQHDNPLCQVATPHKTVNPPSFPTRFVQPYNKDVDGQPMKRVISPVGAAVRGGRAAEAVNATWRSLINVKKRIRIGVWGPKTSSTNKKMH